MAKANTLPPKGSRDFLPEDMRRRSYVTGIIREVFQGHGFEPLETPAMERLETLLGKYGDEGDQLLFKVLLRGEPLVHAIRSASELIAHPENLVHGRSGETAPRAEPLLADLGLRYDLTLPLARVYAAYQGKLPAIFKRFQIQPVWRADTPGKGRFREFFQCDVDIVGSTSRAVEAEVASAACECLERLGFADFTLRINHRGLLRALMDVSGVPVELEGAAIVAVDKLDKIGVEGVGKELEGRGISAAASAKLLKIIGSTPTLDDVAQAVADHEGGRNAIADIRTVLNLAEVTRATSHLVFDVTLARGLGYYTGCIFELNVKELAGSLGGGGRYDGLVGMFLGKEVPACGFSLGLERILVVMEERNMYPTAWERTQVLVAAVEEADIRAALDLSTRLRARGLRVELVPKAIKPGKLRQQAEESGVASAAWIEAGASAQATLWHAGEQSSPSAMTFDALADAVTQRNQGAVS